MPDDQSLIPPQPTRKDAVVEGVKAGLSGPFGILSALMKSPVEKRRDEWMRAVGEALLQLQGRVEGFSIEALAEDELFVSTVMQATLAAQRTHLADKKTALRNAVLNVALKHSPDEVKTEILLNLIDSISVWHIKIVDLFSNPQGWAQRNSKEFPSVWYMGGRGDVLEFAFPELVGKRTFYDPIVKDLYAKGLLAVESLQTMMTKNGMLEPCATEWGCDLMLLIREPDELR
jgi:hypothetical protein